jgi:septum formation protein
VVILDGHLYGKPENREHAGRLLRVLSGKTHKVVSAMYLMYKGRFLYDSVDALVTFARLDEDDIESYLATDQWQGVAGAYNVYGLGARFISRVEGLPSTVAGLPIEPLWRLLRAF